MEQVFKEISLEDCPPEVLAAVDGCFESGRVERILVGRASRRPCFFVEVALAENRVSKLQISEDGELLSRVDGMGKSDLPRTVKSAMTDFLNAGARFDAADRVFTPDHEEFHIELDLGDNLDLHLFLDDRGVLLRQHEVGDF